MSGWRNGVKVDVNNLTEILVEGICNPLNVPEEKKWRIVKATMKEIWEVITWFFEDPKNTAYTEKFRNGDFLHDCQDPLYQQKIDLSNLSDQWLHNRIIPWNFEFSEYYYWAFILDVIEQYRPLPSKPESYFDADM